ncbi:tryptophan synthase subunit alpha [Flavobacterium sp.]|uniref:tryptophan synthase subunit alpha n=1 Tax=Flavobacterium sp. TaxID=239 RepID=UPI002639E01E|nr:tryptophan synthase subunit alpha [Flavobacterium sp.]
MSNRIHQLFESKKETILSIYFTAGYPSLNDTLTIIKNLAESDVDMIEIGFPYSDPLADGPVIQESSAKAIENGMTLHLLFEQLQSLRSITQIPIILMGYLNPVLQFGEKAFIQKCNELGVDGIIIPDMPLNYYQTHLKAICEENNVSNLLLITPETSQQRIKEIDENSNGFIYLVSSNSITGSTDANTFQTNYFERIKSMKLNNPQLIGFGIHDKSSFDEVCKYSSGAIIGSAFIKHLEAKGTTKDSIQTFIDGIRG